MEAARAVSELTHWDPEAGDACVLWCAAIRHATLTGLLDVRFGLQHIGPDRREKWASRLDAAEASQPSGFKNKSWVVEALQGAWCAIATTLIPQDDPATGVFRVDHLRLALDASVRGCGDTDTVAAIAGGLLGAVYGASAVPAQWRRILHGWPVLGTRDLVALATRIVKADKLFIYDTDPVTPVQHPHDDGVWLGNVATLQALPPGVNAVVSLCRVHDDDLPAGVEQIDVRLIDDVGPDANSNLDFVLTDTVRLILQLRNEGRTVLVHCVAAVSRTPTVAALYGTRRQGISGEAALRKWPRCFRTPTQQRLPPSPAETGAMTVFRKQAVGSLRRAPRPHEDRPQTTENAKKKTQYKGRAEAVLLSLRDNLRNEAACRFSKSVSSRDALTLR